MWLLVMSVFHLSVLIYYLEALNVYLKPLQMYHIIYSMVCDSGRRLHRMSTYHKINRNIFHRVLVYRNVNGVNQVKLDNGFLIKYQNYAGCGVSRFFITRLF